MPYKPLAHDVHAALPGMCLTQCCCCSRLPVATCIAVHTRERLGQRGETNGIATYVNGPLTYLHNLYLTSSPQPIARMGVHRV